jgi:hypothetical protein
VLLPETSMSAAAALAEKTRTTVPQGRLRRCIQVRYSCIRCDRKGQSCISAADAIMAELQPNDVEALRAYIISQANNAVIAGDGESAPAPRSRDESARCSVAHCFRNCRTYSRLVRRSANAFHHPVSGIAGTVSVP